MEQPTNPTDALRADMAERNQPSAAAVRQARRLLAAVRQADMVVIPMYWPGKQRSWWEMGQEVRTVPGVLILAVNSFKPAADVPSLSTARNAASVVARATLAGEPGVVGWAYVMRTDSETPVFEDVL